MPNNTRRAFLKLLSALGIGTMVPDRARATTSLPILPEKAALPPHVQLLNIVGTEAIGHEFGNGVRMAHGFYFARGIAVPKFLDPTLPDLWNRLSTTKAQEQKSFVQNIPVCHRCPSRWTGGICGINQNQIADNAKSGSCPEARFSPKPSIYRSSDEQFRNHGSFVTALNLQEIGTPGLRLISEKSVVWGHYLFDVAAGPTKGMPIYVISSGAIQAGVVSNNFDDTPSAGSFHSGDWNTRGQDFKDGATHA